MKHDIKIQFFQKVPIVEEKLNYILIDQISIADCFKPSNFKK